MSSLSPTVKRTTQYTCLLTVQIQRDRESVVGIVDCAASATVVGTRLAQKLGVWKRTQKVNVRHGDESHLSVGNFIVNTSLKVYYFLTSPTSATVLSKFSLYAELLYIGN